ncbi:MAG: hypothetical protein LBP79_04700 [Clostridiales bacterium]|jgi:transposase|nr:hypothetical protein [Clostridiales bacterium]
MKETENVSLSATEEQEYRSVKRYAENHKNIRRLAVELSCSERTARRFIGGYKKEGRAYFAHGNRGKISPRRIPDEARQAVASLYTGKYSGATYAHFTELIADYENLKFSEAFVRSVLREKFLLSPKATRRTRKLVKNQLRKLRETADAEEKEKLTLRILSLSETHPARPRRRYFGELLQTDASEHLWFGTEKTALHIST